MQLPSAFSSTLQKLYTLLEWSCWKKLLEKEGEGKQPVTNIKLHVVQRTVFIVCFCVHKPFPWSDDDNQHVISTCEDKKTDVKCSFVRHV